MIIPPSFYPQIPRSIENMQFQIDTFTLQIGQITVKTQRSWPVRQLPQQNTRKWRIASSGTAVRGFQRAKLPTKRDFRVSGDASQDSESTKPEDSPDAAAISKKSAFTDEHDLDELPDEEPLTPEMVEEEAVRGDFMLRWAAIFLAVLMGFTQINDTKPLVLIRSGDYMRSHGMLPPRTDVFSLTAAEKPAPNVSWLFDHVVSLCWAAGGEKSLTLLKVAIAAIVGYLLTHISIRGVPTWWNSICAVFAIVACSSDFLPLPELITMLGMTITMLWIYQHRMGVAKGLQWKLPLLIAVWCNLDSRAWLGAFVVGLYMAGVNVSNRIAQRKLDARIETDGPSPWLITGLSIAALLVNPFPGNSLLSPVTLYSVEYPAMQAQRRVDIDSAALNFDGRVDYFSVLNPSAARLFDHSQVAALALLLMSFVVLLLARTRRDLGFLFALCGMTVLAMSKAHELPEAAIVAAVVAGISAQDWYRRAFSQQYTLDSKELLFSRGGRAVTVLALAGLGFCVVASRLPGATPLGWGFDQDTRITMDSFASQLKDLDPEARILHSRLEQGDLLIWNGRKSFVDSRMLPFGRPGEADERPDDAKSIFAKHRILLTTLFQPPQPPEDKSQDKAELKKFEELLLAKRTVCDKALRDFNVTHAMTRLAPPGSPDYASMYNLSQSGQWVPISVEASSAILERVQANMPDAERFKLEPNWVEQAFMNVEADSSTLREFARDKNFYEKHVYRVRDFTDENLRMAMHHSTLATQSSALAAYLFGQMETAPSQEAAESIRSAGIRSIQQAFANTILAIRRLNLVLDKYPNQPRAYNLLGLAYSKLGELEQMVSGPTLEEHIRQMRYMQAVMAYRQATVADPNDDTAWNGLLALYRKNNRIDLASDAIDHLLPLLENKLQDSTNPQAQAFLDEQQSMRRELRDMVRDNKKRVDEFVEKQEVPEKEEDQANQVISLAVELDGSGYGLAALKLLNDEQDLIRKNPIGSVTQAKLMLESGQLEDAYRDLAMLADQARQQPQAMGGVEWQFPTALSQLAISDLTSAYDTWSLQLKDLDNVSKMQEPYSGVMASLPLIADGNVMMNAPLPVWPLRHVDSLGLTMEVLAKARADLLFLLAMIRIEEGNVDSAKLLLKDAIVTGGESNYRNLSRVYLEMMDETAEEFLKEHIYSSFEPYEFPGEPEPAAAGAPGARQIPASGVTPSGDVK